MADTAKKAAASKTTEADKPKRKMLTQAEKIAKLEADLEAARTAGAEKAKKKAVVLREQKAKLVAKIKDAQSKVDDIDAELDSYGMGDEPLPTAPAEDETPKGDES